METYIKNCWCRRANPFRSLFYFEVLIMHRAIEKKVKLWKKEIKSAINQTGRTFIKKSPCCMVLELKAGVIKLNAPSEQNQQYIY